MRHDSSPAKLFPFLVAAILAILPAGDGLAACIDSKILGQIFGMDGEYLACDDSMGVSAVAWDQNDPLGTTSGLALIACEETNSQCTCTGVSTLGDGVVTIEADWTDGGMTGCPFGTTPSQVGLYVQGTDGGAVIAVLSNQRLGFEGYLLTGAHRYDPGAGEPVPLVCGPGGGRPLIESVLPAGPGTVQVTLKFASPIVYSDCDADSYGTLHAGPCSDPPALNPARGPVYVRTAECTSRPDLRRLLWSPTGIVPDATGRAVITAPAPAAGECLYVGGTTRISGILSGAITGSVAIPGTPCVDADGDGVTGCAGDCDDANPSVASNQAEVCDEVDQDCDGRIDEGLDCAGTCATPMKNGPDVRITSAPGFSVEPLLVSMGDGFGLGWTDDRDGVYAVYFARLGPSGARIGPERRLSPPGPTASLSSLVWDGDHFGVAWVDRRDGQAELYFALLAADGSPAGPQRRVTTDGVWLAGMTVAPGGFALAWSRPNPGPGGGVDLYFRKLDTLGNFAGPAQQVTNRPEIERGASIAAVAGGYGVAWSDPRLGLDNPEIFFARLDADGVRLGPDQRISHGPGTSEDVTLIAVDDAFAALWRDWRAGGDVPHTYVARLDVDGQALTEVELNALGGFARSIAWTGAEFRVPTGIPLGQPGLYASALDARGVRIGSSLGAVSEPGMSGSQPSLALIPGGFAVAWEDRRTGDTEIWFSLFGCHCVDADEDGYTSCVECDDARAGVHPGLVDACDGADENCTGYADDDAEGQDSDSDLVANACDNCRFAPNPDQADVNSDGTGDLCDLSDGLIMLTVGSSGMVTWQMETAATTFNLYRAGVPGLVDPDHDGAASSYGGCFGAGMPGPSFVDFSVPAAGTAYVYHVTMKGPGGESSLGNASSGAPRPNVAPCP